MLGDYLRFDFGNSLFRNASVMQLMKESLPVSHLARALEHADYLSGLYSAGHS
ncbi:hypothetical protein ACNKHQ_13020 [Shigella flexneri]